ncbi:MAG: conjugal transfer protein TraX [Eubacteriaceae bacterium]|jgi:hypothetical protein|nr:conjugal transfer protein TraX [Eubacteriaceae bacterium]
MENKSRQLSEGNWKLKQGLSGNATKIIAVALMVFDHLHQMFTAQAPEWFTMLGRPVLPVFLFMCAEGFYYTRNRKRYLLHLLVGYWIMSIGNWLIERIFPMIGRENQVVLINNVFGTLFMVALYLLFIEYLKSGIREKNPRKIVGGALLLLAPIAFAFVGFFLMIIPVAGTIVFMLVPNLLTVEAGFGAVLLGIAFYLLRKWRWAQIAALAAISMLNFFTSMGSGSIQWMMVFAIIPLLLYNGKRGGGSKYFFYVFYPAHIWLLYMIAWLLQR